MKPFKFVMEILGGILILETVNMILEKNLQIVMEMKYGMTGRM
jgi:hypothetical protein